MTGSGEKYIMKSLMICTPHQILLGDQIEKNELGGVCSMCKVEERCLQSFGGET